MAKKTARSNPYAAFNFIVTFQNQPLAGFMEVTGLDTENAVIEYREGSDQTNATGGAFVRKLPGLERYPNVMLKRGITGELKLWNDLRQPVRDAKLGPMTLDDFRSVTPTLVVELQNEQHETVQKWTLQNAWVSKMTGPMLNAKSNEIAIESIEVVCDRITPS